VLCCFQVFVRVFLCVGVPCACVHVCVRTCVCVVMSVGLWKGRTFFLCALLCVCVFAWASGCVFWRVFEVVFVCVCGFLCVHVRVLGACVGVFCLVGGRLF